MPGHKEERRGWLLILRLGSGTTKSPYSVLDLPAEAVTL